MKSKQAVERRSEAWGPGARGRGHLWSCRGMPATLGSVLESLEVLTAGVAGARNGQVVRLATASIYILN